MYPNLTIVAVPDPPLWFEEDSNSYHRQPERYLGDLGGDEWGAIFHEVLKCPLPSDNPPLPNESGEEWQERFSQMFQQTIPEYPMLGEIWHLDIYVSYQPEEIRLLRDECLKVRAKTSNEEALKGISQLIWSCDEALKLGYGLIFIPD